MTNEEAFREYLRRSGRSPSAVERCVAAVEAYEDWLQDRETGATALVEYVHEIESVPKASAKLHLWALAYYFDFAGEPEVRDLCRTMRAERIDRKPFALRDFRGVDPLVADRLAGIGITNVDHMNHRGRTVAQRVAVAGEADLPVDRVDELARLSDLARIPGVKGIRARLYHDAGVTSVAALAAWDPTQLREHLIRFCADTRFDGAPPLPAEVEHAVATARRLPTGVED